MATLASVQSDYETNADYAEVGSQSKARAFITACRRLLIKLPAESSKGGSGAASVAWNVELVQREKAAAEQWLSTHPGDNEAPSVIYPDFGDFRQ